MSSNNRNSILVNQIPRSGVKNALYEERDNAAEVTENLLTPTTHTHTDTHFTHFSRTSLKQEVGFHRIRIKI